MKKFKITLLEKYIYYVEAESLEEAEKLWNGGDGEIDILRPDYYTAEENITEIKED